MRTSIMTLCILTTALTSMRGPLAAQTPAQLSQVADALALRPIGPAVMGGRIADIAVHPTKRSTWYVAVGSGNLWKTTNAGVTWTPIFDDQPSYSIGDVTLDPSNPDVVWVGTGENVSGRHVAWGTGVYRSRNGGASWEQVGLDGSEHIGKILVDPRNSNVVFVAAEGPLWASGGDRGVYRSSDGGTTWEHVLAIDENTGVTDIEFHPTNPDVIYAAAYQRRRHVWSFLAGGPNSGIYKSTDGGDTWRRITVGLPSGDVGKIGLAVTTANPEIVYATMEADDSERGFYRSLDQGESFEKRSSYVSGGTGEHYYQELEASHHNADHVYQMDVFIQVTRDGGASFGNLSSGRNKHSDNHAMWLDPDDPNHAIVGTDGGLYETFDDGATYRHFENLPISQFYFAAIDNSEPFYNLLGGAQDLGTLYGPTRTMNVEGVRNRDWYVPMGADGADVQFDPSDPNTFYIETQQGNLYRYDKRSEEALDIQPQPAPGDEPERWTWNAPIHISPHASNRVYFGSQRLWRSDDRGDSWTAVSGDLTTNTNRYELEHIGRVWSVDALYHNGAMSKYATITAISESPVAEGVIYTGSDDGLIQVTENSGATWSRAADLPGVPPRAFINDVEASQLDANVVFAAADAHKIGNFTPFLFRSDDRGGSWQSIVGDLPGETIVWVIQQDHVNPDLLFIGTEYGVYFSVNGGTNWTKLGGTPTMAFRDLDIHRRDNDVVATSFGRGFFVLDDYTPLRTVGAGAIAGGSTIFPVRDAWWYVPYVPMQAPGKPTLGSDDFTTPNPDFGATFTYFIDDVPQTARDARRDREREIRDAGGNVPFPGWDALRAETVEGGPRVLLMVRDEQGQPVRWLEGATQAGFHRISWDLRRPATDPIDLFVPDFIPPWASDPQGPLAPPGRYAVELVLVTPAGVEMLGTPQDFIVKPVPTAPPGTDFIAVTNFMQETSELMRRVAAAGEELGRSRDRLRHMRAALLQTPDASPTLFGRMDDLNAAMADMRLRLNGDPVRGGLNENSVPSISNRVFRVSGGHWDTRQTPTATHRRNLEIATADFAALKDDLRMLVETTIPALEADLEAAGAPWTPGRRLPTP